MIVASIAKGKASKSAELAIVAGQYLSRAEHMCSVESVSYATQESLVQSARRSGARTVPALVLFDATGDQLTSNEFAMYVAGLRDRGLQQIYFAVGPASGWGSATLARADRVISLGRMTLPHELARVVVAEQIYRALTILAGHPYHSGH